MAKKHLFFDMDGTLTPSRGQISGEMINALAGIIEKGVDVVIVSGARGDQMMKQIGNYVSEHVFFLSQNGNVAVHAAGRLIWKNELTWIHKADIFKVIEQMPGSANVGVVTSLTDIVEDRGCQISYSLIGHNAPVDQKKAIDPDAAIRKGLLETYAGPIEDLKKMGVTAAIGGTTCIDFYLHNKGENVARLIKEMEWKASDCVYYGDALFPGGNDESVIDVIKTVEVKDPEETLHLVQQLVA